MKLKTVSKWLVVLGALEVGLMGVLGFDLVGTLLGSWPFVVSCSLGSIRNAYKEKVRVRV